MRSKIPSIYMEILHDDGKWRGYRYVLTKKAGKELIAEMKALDETVRFAAPISEADRKYLRADVRY